MPAPNPIRTIARLAERHSDRAWCATLPNGKSIIAHLPRKHTEALAGLEPGQSVHLEITAYDFSAGRIAGPA